MKEDKTDLESTQDVKQASEGTDQITVTKPKNKGKMIAERKRRNKKKYQIAPEEIVKSILSKSSFKIPNLSNIVCDKFYDSRYETKFRKQIEDINYDKPVVDFDPNNDHIILPEIIDPSMIIRKVPAHAMTDIISIYDKPYVKYRRHGKGGHKKRGKSKKNNQFIHEKNNTTL